MENTPGTEIPSHRACAHCRSQKVRCIPEDGNVDVCQRCARAGRPCVFTPIQKRKQRKRTDTRVAELEREMRGMRALLKNKEEAAKTPPHETTSPVEIKSSEAQRLWSEKPMLNGEGLARQPDVEPSQGNLGTAKHAVRFAQPEQSHIPLSHNSPLWPDRLPERPRDIGNDVVDRGLLSMATARQLFNTYRTDLFPHYPMVAIPASTSADEMRHTRPTLFLAVIAAAASQGDSELSATLDKEVLQAYATRSLVQSEKSLELVQSLLISALWYHPPNKFGQLKYYEFIHMAATMAMDIGIGTAPLRRRHSRFGKDNDGRGRVLMGPPFHPAEDATNPDLSMTPRSRNSSPDTGNTECRRTFLACYTVCALVSLSLRRPNMLRVSSYVRECVEYIERSSDVISTDRTVLAWVKLVMIGEEVSVSFSYDDPGGIARMSELRTQLMLKDFDRRLDAWLTSISETDTNGSLMIMYYTVRMYLHEIALHVDHSPEDFRAPYQMGIVHQSGDNEEIPTQVLADSVASCITCSHALLDTFLAMEVDSLRALPVFGYVRVSFAAFVLAKLCLSAAHPGSRIGKVLDRSSLKVENYVDRTILHVREIVGPHRSRVPAIFLALLFKIRQWCLNPHMIQESSPPQRIGRETDHAASVLHLQLPDAAPAAFVPPRLMEQVSGSSDGNSNSPRSRRVAWDDLGETATQEAVYQATAGLTPESSSSRYHLDDTVRNGSLDSVAGGISIPQDGAGGISIPQDGAQVPATDPMQLDDEFLAGLGDLSGFPEGGLEGFDDWTTAPNDFVAWGTMPVFSWPTPPPPL